MVQVVSLLKSTLGIQVTSTSYQEYENPVGYGILAALDPFKLIIEDMIKQKQSTGSYYREDFKKIC